jgi:bifunctional non-homologous end joining protein LigD
MPRQALARDASIKTYHRSKRNFAVTAEPAGHKPKPNGAASMFVIQKHHAHRAGLHWDFRLEHNGVLWSWAVPKGPSLDPADRRVAIHVEDHPIEYADFQGEIPAGQYGGGQVETWDRGTWTPLEDPETGMRKGSLRFVLSGKRLSGRFTLARLNRRDPKKQEAWFLIKGHDEEAREGVDALAIEREMPAPLPPRTRRPARSSSAAPAKGAMKGTLPTVQAPQLCALAEEPPEGPEWISEIKFDGYRLLAAVEHGKVRLLTRNGLDWADRMPAMATAIGKLSVASAMIDGELVSLREDGISSFPGLQAALKAGRDEKLTFYAFDLLHLNGWDLRSCALLDRKQVLRTLADWTGMLRYSDHVAGSTHQMRLNACRMHLEGIVCKQADAPYKSGRGHGWVKVKCSGREELLVLGWTPPGGSRKGIGALHVGYYDPEGRLHYAGGVGSGYSEKELTALRKRLDGLKAEAPLGLLVSGDPLDRSITWVKPELVVEVQFTDWSGAGRVRHPVFLGLREDKTATEVVRDVADPDAARTPFEGRQSSRAVIAARKGWHGAVPPSRPKAPPPSPEKPVRTSATIVEARAPKPAPTRVGGIELTHADRQLWPGITKKDLAEYWQAVAEVALLGIAHRPLSIVRCPAGIDGERFFQKNGHGFMPAAIREGSALRSPYLAIDDVDGLIAMAQMSAIELHPWGASEADPAHPDWLVFDLDPGDGVPWGEVVNAAHDVRKRLQRLQLQSFCRPTGGKGLHVVVPVEPEAEWDRAKAFCRTFAETMSQEFPDRYLAHLKIADRRGKILVDWLRNGLGATAVSSYCPRARPGATVATPLAWDEVSTRLAASAFTVQTVPKRVANLAEDPWQGFHTVKQRLADLVPSSAISTRATKAGPLAKPAKRSVIVHAASPKSRR